MIADTLLACWLIACAYVPLVLVLTSEPPSEVRRVTNALVGQRAAVIALTEPTIASGPAAAEGRALWRAAVEPTLTGAAPAWVLEESES